MENNFLDFETFADESRTWIYQSNRNFSLEEVDTIEKLLNDFCIQWTAHNNQLRAAGKIFYKRFIVLMVDKNLHDASGCSIDKSIHYLKEIESKFNIQLFNRLEIAYEEAGEIKTFSLSQFNNFIEQKIISPSTIIFNNAISTKKEMNENWKIRLEDSWQKKFLNNEITA